MYDQLIKDGYFFSARHVEGVSIWDDPVIRRLVNQFKEIPQ